MRSFTDSTGRTWTVSLTVDAVKRVRALLGIDLLQLESGDPPLLTRLGTDVVLVCDVIYAIVKPQADAAGISDEEFGRSLGGDAILAAQKAFYEELVDFFRQLGRTDLVSAIQVLEKLIAAGIEQVEKKISEIDVSEVVRSISGEASTN